MNPAVDSKGRVWVAASFDNQFWIFDRDGHFLEAWGTPGKGDGQFNFARDSNDSFGAVAFAADGGFYVADTGNHRIQRFDRNRKFLGAWGTFGTDDGQFAGDTSVAMDGAGNVYVDDASRADIQMFKPDGSYVHTFAGGIAGPPFAVDAPGNVYYVDEGTRTLTRAGPDGTVTLTVDLSAYFSFIAGVAVDNRGDIFVDSGETNPERLVEIDPSGKVLHAWPIAASGGEGFVLDPAGDRIYLSFYNADYVRAYQLPAGQAAGGASSPSASGANGLSVAVAPAATENALPIGWQSAGPAPRIPCTSHPAIAPDGKLWVSACFESTFWIFSPQGKYLESWGTPGSGDGQLNFLTSGGRDAIGGVAFAPDGSFYTFEAGNRRVQHFDKSRHFLSSWGGFGTDPGQFAQPVAIAMDREQRVYVADKARSDVQIFAADGTYLRTIAQDWEGPDTGSVGYMAVTPAGNVFLSRSGAVREYASDGSKLAEYDLRAVAPDTHGVAVDAVGHIFVVGASGPVTWISTIEIAPDGHVIHLWPATGEMLALDPSGHALYATEFDWPFARRYNLPST